MLMSPSNEEYWEAEYWDDYLKEFGVEAYTKARYGLEQSPVLGVSP